MIDLAAFQHAHPFDVASYERLIARVELLPLQRDAGGAAVILHEGAYTPQRNRQTKAVRMRLHRLRVTIVVGCNVSVGSILGAKPHTDYNPLPRYLDEEKSTGPAAT
jgi:hypothetical protein